MIHPESLESVHPSKTALMTFTLILDCFIISRNMQKYAETTTAGAVRMMRGGNVKIMLMQREAFRINRTREDQDHRGRQAQRMWRWWRRQRFRVSLYSSFPSSISAGIVWFSDFLRKSSHDGNALASVFSVILIFFKKLQKHSIIIK